MNQYVFIATSLGWWNVNRRFLRVFPAFLLDHVAGRGDTILKIKRRL